MKLKLRKMVAAGDARAAALLKKMEARGIMKSLDAAEDATKSVLKQLDEAPSRAIAKATGGRFMPQKQRAQVVGKTEDAPTASGLFEADATTTPPAYHRCDKTLRLEALVTACLQVSLGLALRLVPLSRLLSVLVETQSVSTKSQQPSVGTCKRSTLAGQSVNKLQNNN